MIADSPLRARRVHVVHITSMGLKDTPKLIAMIEGARKSGLDVTTECYPYTAASTFLESAVFDPGWRERMEIDYKDLQWTETGERLTAESFAKYRRQGGSVVIFVIPENCRSCRCQRPPGHDRERRHADYRAESSSSRAGYVFPGAGTLCSGRAGT